VIFVDQYARTLEVGDLVVAKEITVQEFAITAIKEDAIAVPGKPPMAMITLHCEVSIPIPSMGQPVQSLPLLLVKKKESKLVS
jgi:hypothetical protein